MQDSCSVLTFQNTSVTVLLFIPQNNYPSKTYHPMSNHMTVGPRTCRFVAHGEDDSRKKHGRATKKG